MPQPVAKLSKIEARKKISILGATGTIGKNTIDIIEQHPEKYEIQALTAGQNVDEIISIARKLKPKFVAIQDESQYSKLKSALQNKNIDVGAGAGAIIEAAQIDCDLLMSGIVGVAALEPTIAAIKNGTNVALANKECLVCAGKIIVEEATKHNVQILPVDSEHNSLFQTFDFANPERIKKITLTASGGPFHKISLNEMQNISPEQAVRHPNWNMGAKISIDSATMMNKGLEVIEAYHLFPIEKDQIDVVIHPESVVHSLISYIDGAVVAGLSNPDMKVPIAFALGWPERIPTSTKNLDLTEIGKLTFEKVDNQKFPALNLAKLALAADGSAPTILNAANEIAVQSFLERKIQFLDIVKLVENALQDIPHTKADSIEEILNIDKQTREFCLSFIKQGK
mgnify:CR=1 FL=1